MTERVTSTHVNNNGGYELKLNYSHAYDYKHVASCTQNVIQAKV